jgi:hypothetical protein
MHRRLEQARLEGAHLAARTLEHFLNNHLALTVGYTELISEDPELPERLRDMARQALEGAQQCARAIRRMRDLDELEFVEGGLSGEPLIDLERSEED